MTPLEKRLIEDMKLFGYSKRTQDTYLYAVRKITKHFQTSPDQITNEQLREYLLWHKDKYAPNTTTIALCGIKFFYQKILKKPMPVFDLVRQPRGLKLPVVLTQEEVRTVLSNIRVLRHRACLTLIYSCGLRISEAVEMQISQIDSNRMVVHVRAGKGARDRYVPLPRPTLELLRCHWKTHRHPQWLFPAPGRSGVKEAEATRCLPLSSVQTVFKKSLKEVGIKKDAHVHTLRHSYATHLLEEGVDIRIISEYLGHRSLDSTLIYTHLTPLMRQGVADTINSLMGGLTQGLTLPQ
ncbi:MAG: tyrosine-type recombinase/integrase [Bacteroidetes bacterium]|jgi:site-specific recombinase XerD|nr:tyrosine-type recombinase/integrase [Bacteroidota bacterium]